MSKKKNIMNRSLICCKNCLNLKIIYKTFVSKTCASLMFSLPNKIIINPINILYSKRKATVNIFNWGKKPIECLEFRSIIQLISKIKILAKVQL